MALKRRELQRGNIGNSGNIARTPGTRSPAARIDRAPTGSHPIVRVTSADLRLPLPVFLRRESMRHHCTACMSEFVDEGPLPESDCVHCVFCGARIPLRRRVGSSVVPFSKDYEREEAFALGVIAGIGPGFPDTLKQFRVRGAPKLADSLTPVAGTSEPPAPTGPGARSGFAALSVSLGIGFGAGVAIAFAAVSLLRDDRTQRAQSALPAGRAGARAGRLEPASSASPLGTSSAPAPPSSAAPETPPKAVPKVASPMTDRRWLLDMARAKQRQYRLTEAERLYRRVLQRSPRDSEALSGIGELDLLRGTVDLADLHFQEALSANADYIPALVAAADIRWQSGRFEEARQAYRDIVDRYSADLYPPYVVLRSAATGTAPAACP
jgi:hypothetical protein